jgi:hypothetical protein
MPALTGAVGIIPTPTSIVIDKPQLQIEAAAEVVQRVRKPPSKEQKERKNNKERAKRKREKDEKQI